MFVSEISGEGTNQRREEESEEDDSVKVHLMQDERDFFFLLFQFVVKWNADELSELLSW